MIELRSKKWLSRLALTAMLALPFSMTYAGDALSLIHI